MPCNRLRFFLKGQPHVGFKLQEMVLNNRGRYLLWEWMVSMGVDVKKVIEN